MQLNDMVLMMLESLILFICVLVGVAFLTLLERKVLGFIQIRKGPNKVGYCGVVQPFSDAIKLFSKEQTFPFVSNYLPYYFSPVFSLFISLLVWSITPSYFGLFSFDLGLLFFLCCTSVGVYTVMVAGWSSNSLYALLGGLRAVAQTISYEVSLALILISFIILSNGYNLCNFYLYQSVLWFIFITFPLMIVWFASSLAETNRTPFDFAEGESELVSGFNIEYSSGGFALIFMAEYASILFMSMLFVILFLGGDFYYFFFILKVVMMSFMFIWVRGTLPRYRYDKLMYLAWKSFLPVSLNYLIFFSGLKIVIISLLI
uniref:NADH-ubiquinone oxidoreductase chain 1 n=1 Tax=Neurothemis fulvia TaxID=342749 RepID=A0A7M1I7M8_9ODON|nr:NADH dehydrogenase subunit 1 [Neurothemis fulvia]QOQ35065.1 NADH dehydrogenase subunit 1 [Neurothemis fulvia]